LAATLAIAPTAFGDAFKFTYTNTTSGESANGTLDATALGFNGEFQVTSGTITITGSEFSGTGTIDTNSGDLGSYGADNLLFTLENAGRPGYGSYDHYVDWGGLLFTTTNGLNNLWAGDNNGYGSSYSLSGNNGNFIDYPGAFTLTAVTPDGGTTLAFLGLAIAGLAGLRRKFGILK
jgi:hypothetical protein